jgi:hypothetical protein
MSTALTFLLKSGPVGYSQTGRFPGSPSMVPVTCGLIGMIPLIVHPRPQHWTSQAGFRAGTRLRRVGNAPMTTTLGGAAGCEMVMTARRCGIAAATVADALARLRGPLRRAGAGTRVAIAPLTGRMLMTTADALGEISYFQSP